MVPRCWGKPGAMTGSTLEGIALPKKRDVPLSTTRPAALVERPSTAHQEVRRVPATSSERWQTILSRRTVEDESVLQGDAILGESLIRDGASGYLAL
ncbi:hypothetical protein NDU88_008749 [Pleurodeles waltl]|uniref:Uncharacterized protein n=1 Tax=Pleurodeles waltl TaxID=8319 RepID=A0AAV7QPN2_PLEWA|nr:hypothetical protein NDU88_008749 [Pleurodeles waltl]